jgi:hypothetical protein
MVKAFDKIIRYRIVVIFLSQRISESNFGSITRLPRLKKQAVDKVIMEILLAIQGKDYVLTYDVCRTKD